MTESNKECERCGAKTAAKNMLPLSDYRDLTGEDPVLCGDCRVALVRWISSDTERGGKLAENSDATRSELLGVIEEANDLLAESLHDANVYMRADELRPSAVRAFDRVQEAHNRLVEVDASRSVDIESDRSGGDCGD